MTVRHQIRGTTAAEITASVESGVQDGALPAGAALPPVRTLAGTLGLSPATVASAYRTLRQRGIIETAGRRGTRVRPRPPAPGVRAARHLPVPPGVLDLSAGAPDPRLLPALAPHLLRLAASPVPPASYPDTAVLPELAAMATDRFAADGVPTSGAAVLVTGGALDGIERLLAAHLSPGDRVAVEDPGWANLLDLVATLGLTPLAVPTDDEGPTADGLRRALAGGARAAVVTTRAHNPTGAAVSQARAATLRAVLASHPDVLLIEDDHAAELAAVPLHPLAGTTTGWAFVRSVSKPYGPDLRLAVVIGDPASVGRVAGRMRAGTGWVSTVLQRLVVSLWKDPEVAAGVAAAAESYQRRRTALREALRARGVASRGRTGVNVWVPVRDETVAVTVLRDAGFAVAPGALFRLESPPGIRITVSQLPEDATETASTLAAALTASVADPATPTY